MLLFQRVFCIGQIQADWTSHPGPTSGLCLKGDLPLSGEAFPKGLTRPQTSQFLSVARLGFVFLAWVVLGMYSLGMQSWASADGMAQNHLGAASSFQSSASGAIANSANQDRQQVLVQAASTDDWIEMKPKNAGASFKMITKPRYLERVLKPVDDQPSIKMRSHLSTFQNGDGLMVFMYSDLPEEPTGKAVVDTLEGIALGSVTNLNGKITHYEKIRYKDYPGLSYEFRFAKDEQLHGGVGRAFLVGKRQYVISVMMKEANFDQATALAFFESFRINVEEESKADQIPEK